MKKKKMTVQARAEHRGNVSKINVNKGKLAELHDLIVKESRPMTDEEKDIERTLVAENEQLELRNQVLMQPEYSDDDASMSQDDAFEAIVRSLAKTNRLDDKYEYLRNEKGEFVYPINLNAADHQYRAIQTSGSVEPITPVTVKDIIEPLENALIFGKVGTTIQYGIQGTWNYPVLNTTVEAEWLAEDGVAPDKTLEFGKLAPTPHRLAISIPINNLAINQSAGQISAIVNKQIQLSLQRSLNKAFFATVTSPNAPNGVFKDVTPGTITVGKEWAGLLAMKGTVASANIPNDGSACYVMNEATYWKLCATPRDAGSGLMVADNYLINGTPVYTTGEMADDTVGYGYFSYLLCGFFGNISLGADSTSAAVRKSDQTVFVLNAYIDYLRLRKEAFALSNIASV